MDGTIGEIFAEIISTKLFVRLSGVSFLGIVDKYKRINSRKIPVFSRADHSIGVANLGFIAAKEANLSEDEAKHLIASCLLHDLGHPAFSHSFEYAFPNGSSIWNHHNVLENILLNPTGPDREINKRLAKLSLSPIRIAQILDGRDDLSGFFFSPINIDTVDGIIRSMWSFGIFAKYDRRLLVKLLARIYRRDVLRSKELVRSIDMFWQDKGRFYRFIESNDNVAALERRFQEAVRRHIPRLTRAHFRLDDETFCKRYPQVMLETERGDGHSTLPRATQEFLIDETVNRIDLETINHRYRRLRHDVPKVPQH